MAVARVKVGIQPRNLYPSDSRIVRSEMRLWGPRPRASHVLRRPPAHVLRRPPAHVLRRPPAGQTTRR